MATTQVLRAKRIAIPPNRGAGKPKRLSLNRLKQPAHSEKNGGAQEESKALRLDAKDPLRSFRNQFHFPRHGGKPAVYLCGHSLGLQPKAARPAVEQELEDWARLGVNGHFHGRSPWFGYHENFRGPLARLVGAKEGEAVAMNGLSINLHLMMATFYRPTAERFKILMEEPAFPSDLYAVKSQIAARGFHPSLGLLLLKPREGEHSIRIEDLEAMLDTEGSKIALVLLSGVNFLTGQALPIARVTAAAKRRGIAVGWDLAHAVGNLELSLHDWDVDFAVWCSYKYLNGGPGAIGGCFVHESHGLDASLPRLAGWWGHDPQLRFRMQLEPEFKPQPCAEGWQVSNPPILSAAPLRASLALFDKAGMPALRAKSEQLTAHLLSLLDRIQNGRYEIITPRDPSARGCQISILTHCDGRNLSQKLERAGILCDFREPNVIRVAPAPLYNSFHDVWKFAQALARNG